MAQVINTNVASLNAQRNLNQSQASLNTSLERLSSGLRINSAKDDAAGLAISERFTSQIKGLDQAVRNANDGISLAQTAEGALQETGNILQRMRELSVQSANSTNSASDRDALQAEVNQLQQEMSRIANTTTFNGLNILDGTFTEQQFQVGANANETINVSIGGARASDLGNFNVDSVNATVNNGTGSASVAATDLSAETNTIGGQSLKITTGDGTSESVGVNAGDSAAQVAAAVNAKSGTTGVTAEATNEATLSGLSADGQVDFTLSSSGGGSANISAFVTQTDLTALADDINAKAGKTGITAELGGDLSKLTLKDAAGNDINIENFDHDNATTTINVTGLDSNAQSLTQGGTDSTIVAGKVTFDSAEAFSVQSNAPLTAGSVLGAAQDTAAVVTETNIDSVDISSVTGSNDAIALIDSAIQQVSTIRADLGAVQNRFDSTISNLQTTAENASAARSRIVDADFASETANLTRAQILQQAGTAMLAQANSLPQNVLSLLS
mgnify:CR=1 FL=1